MSFCQVSSGSHCKVSDPLYGRVFDLNSLRKNDGSGYKVPAKGKHGEDYTFTLSVCHSLTKGVPEACMKDKVAACQEGDSSTTVTGITLSNE